MKQKWLILIALLVLVGGLLITSSYQPTEKPLPLPALRQTSPVQPTQAPPESYEADPWVIRPRQVGKITPQSTLKDLQKAYGAANVRLSQVAGPEGETYAGAVLFPNEPRKRLEIIWSEKTKNTVGDVRIRAEFDDETGEPSKNGTLWHTEDGITLGTSLKTLETLNGGPFTLSGFSWDYGGFVLSWGDHGKLREKYADKLSLRLRPSERANEEALDAVTGDKTISSGDPHMQAVRPVVDEMIVMF